MDKLEKNLLYVLKESLSVLYLLHYVVKCMWTPDYNTHVIFSKSSALICCYSRLNISREEFGIQEPVRLPCLYIHIQGKLQRLEVK